jgi:hypothetical protein
MAPDQPQRPEPEPVEDEKYPETYDAVRGVGILSGMPPNEVCLGPLRRAPAFYAGKTYKGQKIQNHDAERYRSGAIVGTRNKAARRLIRKALKRRYAKTERAPQLARDMQAQAAEVAKAEGKSNRWARRLYEKELAIHQPVYAPTKKELRKMRTQKRKDARAGKVDAIGQLVDAMAAKKP